MTTVSIVIIRFVDTLTTVLSIAIFIRILFSWFPIDPRTPLVQLLYQITEPILAPFRRIIPTIGFLDISPMIAIIVLQLIPRIVRSLLL